MKNVVFVWLILYFVCSSYAEESSWDKLCFAADKFIKAKSPDVKSNEKWVNKFKGKVDDRVDSTKLSFDQAAQSVVYDWMAGNEKPLREKKEDTMIEVSRIFCWLHSNKIDLPKMVRDNMGDEKMISFAKYLEEQSMRKYPRDN